MCLICTFPQLFKDYTKMALLQSSVNNIKYQRKPKDLLQRIDNPDTRHRHIKENYRYEKHAHYPKPGLNKMLAMILIRHPYYSESSVIEERGYPVYV